MLPLKAVTVPRVLSIVGGAALALWAAWWLHALYFLDLPFAEKTWLVFPAFGADFWSQSEYAARLFASGIDPYASEGHLFHYPPLVIRLFLWVNYCSENQSLRIWVGSLIALLVAGAVVAH